MNPIDTPYQTIPMEYNSGQMTYPNQMSNPNSQFASLIELLSGYDNMLIALRREFRGEVLHEDDKGNTQWIQLTKPLFIVKDNITKKALFKPNPVILDKQDYITNDEAIDELLSCLKLMGINKITPLTSLDENEIIADLNEFEKKMAALLTAKQQSWGLDKESMPMLMAKIKTIVKDARYIAKDGALLKALRSTVQRMEQVTLEQQQKGNWKNTLKSISPYS
jgi:hypothetical protein